MHIEEIEVFRVHMPLVYPFRTAFGNDAEIESVIVKMRAGGLTGWGEATPWRTPGYSGEFAESACTAIRRFLAPRLIGEQVESGERLQKLLSPVKGNYFAKAALDTAWWDLEAKRTEQPLYRLLGGTDPEVTVGADFGIMERIEDLVDAISGAVEEGFARTKLKYRPGWEIEMIEAVRTAHPDHTIHVDCNAAYRLTDSGMLKQLDNYNLAMIEQPLAHDDLYDHSRLAAELSTPICLDESITSVDRVRKAHALGACGWINVKPGRLGGLTVAKAVLKECETLGIPCWIGGMLESSLGGHQCLALATLPNIKYPNDVFPSNRFYSRDLSLPELELSGRSTITAPETPGSGAEPDLDRLAESTIETAIIGGS